MRKHIKKTKSESAVRFTGEQAAAILYADEQKLIFGDAKGNVTVLHLYPAQRVPATSGAIELHTSQGDTQKTSRIPMMDLSLKSPQGEPLSVRIGFAPDEKVWLVGSNEIVVTPPEAEAKNE